MIKKVHFILFMVILLFTCTLFPSSCGNSNEVVKDGITYRKVKQTTDGITVECYYVYGCDDDIEILNIAETINGLSVLGFKREAFKNKTNLKEVTIPNTIKSISLNEAPFLGCTNIEKLTLATDEVKNLFKRYGNTDENNINPLPQSLKKIYLTSGCKKISARSFQFCRYLEELHIPSSVTEIDDGTGGTTIGVNEHTLSGEDFEDLPFLACENLTIFCTTLSQPSGWDKYWNYINASTKATVVWANYNSENSPSIDKDDTEKLLAILDPVSIKSYVSGTTINTTKTGAIQIGFNRVNAGFMWKLDDYSFSTYCKYKVIFNNLSFSSVDDSVPLSLKLNWNDSSHNFLKYYNANTKYFENLNNNYRYLYFDSTFYDEYTIDFMFNHYNITATTSKNLYFDFYGVKSGGMLTFDSAKIYYIEL